MSTARPSSRDRQIVEIMRISSRPASTVGVMTRELTRVPRRHDPTVALLLVSSVVLLVVGVAAMSIVAWLAGVVSLVAAFAFDTSATTPIQLVWATTASSSSDAVHDAR